MILQFCKKKWLLEIREDNRSLVFYLKFFSLYFHEVTLNFFLFEWLGVDLAYTANGHVYHTNYDTPAAVTPGSIQRAGDNILALIKGIVNSPYLADPGEYRHGAVVFFDFLGIIMVHYPERISLVINVLTAFVVVLCLIRKFLGFPGKKDVKKGKKMFSTVYMCEHYHFLLNSENCQKYNVSLELLLLYDNLAWLQNSFNISHKALIGFATLLLFCLYTRDHSSWRKLCVTYYLGDDLSCDDEGNDNV